MSHATSESLIGQISVTRELSIKARKMELPSESGAIKKKRLFYGDTDVT